jgi:hypothetical protein
VNAHRLNTNFELSDTVLHESRHCWQDTQANLPNNDKDHDFLVEQAAFKTPGSAFNYIQEAHSIGMTSPQCSGAGIVPTHSDLIPDDYTCVVSPSLEADAVPFADTFKTMFP